MRSRVQQWGNSLAVRLPKHLATEVALTSGSEVELELSHGQLVIKPVRPQFTLDELLENVKPSKLHEATEWGPAVGREVW